MQTCGIKKERSVAGENLKSFVIGTNRFANYFVGNMLFQPLVYLAVIM